VRFSIVLLSQHEIHLDFDFFFHFLHRFSMRINEFSLEEIMRVFQVDDR